MIRCSSWRSISSSLPYLNNKLESEKQLVESKKNKEEFFVRFWWLPKKEMVNEVNSPNIHEIIFDGLTLDQYNLLIKTYIQKAGKDENEDEALKKLHKAYLLYEHVRGLGLKIEEETYSPIYMFLKSKKEMVEQFTFFHDKLVKDHPDAQSYLLYIEATSKPNAEIEEMIADYMHLLDKAKIAPSSKPLEKFIKTCNDSSKVSLAINLLQYMGNKGLTVSLSTLQDILKSCQRTCEYHKVYRIQSILNDHKLRPDHETFRIMISLYVNLKNFSGAFDMVRKMRRLRIFPNCSIYNTIMLGFLKEKRFAKALEILGDMDNLNVKPDSHTFTYLIGHCNNETDIIKYYKKFNESGVKPTKHIFSALINAYAACGMFEKAKQILSYKEIPQENLDEIKNTLVSVLATNGQMADALKLYDELKHVDPKVDVFITKHIDFKNELGRLMRILKQLEDSKHWQNVCANIILYCFCHKLLSHGVDLLKKFMEKSGTSNTLSKLLVVEIFAQVTDTQFGLDLLQSIKGNILFQPSRKCHDFVLSSCYKDKNLQRCYNVWEEYRKSALRYNSLSYTLMYEVLMAMGEKENAQSFYKHIKDDGDSDVLLIANICEKM